MPRSTSSNENWRKSRLDEDLQATGDGWRANSYNKWRRSLHNLKLVHILSFLFFFLPLTARSQNWRDDDTSTSVNDNSSITTGGSGGRSYAGAASVDTRNSLNDRGGSALSGSLPSKGGFGLRKSWNKDYLPEWAMDDRIEPGGGSFDASGAFHGAAEDDELETKGDGDPNEAVATKPCEPSSGGVQSSTDHQITCMFFTLYFSIFSKSLTIFYTTCVCGRY